MPAASSAEPVSIAAAGDSRRRRVVVTDLTKTYTIGGKPLTAVDRVSFALEEGEFVSLLGPSGCGKSTVLNMIAGLIPKSGGEVLIDGDPQRPGKADKRVGYVFQRDTLYPWRSVRRNIGYGLELAKLSRAELQRRVTEAIGLVGLNGFADAFPLTLSGGMRQRAALMRTLIMEPEILLMDEPFGALDTHTKLDMHKLLMELWERRRQTVLFVTHDLNEALILSDRIILLSARPGRLKEEFVVPWPHPRDPVSLPETPEYNRMHNRIWHSLGEEFRRGGGGEP